MENYMLFEEWKYTKMLLLSLVSLVIVHIDWL